MERTYVPDRLVQTEVTSFFQALWTHWDSVRVWLNPEKETRHPAVGSSGQNFEKSKRPCFQSYGKFYCNCCRVDVENWCKRCATCVIDEVPRTRARGSTQKQQYNVGSPFEKNAVDIVSLFPVTEDEDKYIIWSIIISVNCLKLMPDRINKPL